MSKVFIFGVDGATFDLIRPWAEQGHLPHFARLMKEGTWGQLASVPSMRSPAAWTSFITGTNPGKHGIYEFYEPVPGTYGVRFVHGGMRHGASFWRLLSDAGRKVGIINVPMSYPAEPVDGFVIAGLDAPGVESKGFCYPESIRDELKQKFGEYIIEPGLTGCITRGRPDLGAELLMKELRQKEAVARHLMQKHPWDCFAVVFRSLDAAQHCYWKYMDPTHPHHDPAQAQVYGQVIFDAYCQLDSSLGRIRDMLDDDTTIMVMSDHGFGRKHPASTQLNRWLASRGLLGYPARKSASFSTRMVGKLYRLVSARASRRTKEMLANWLPRLRDKVQSQICYADFDWQATKAYADGLFPAIRINLKGREPEGVVEPGEEYDRLVERLKAELAECRDSVTGQPIVEAVYHRDEIYTGPHVDGAPDLLIRWSEEQVIHGLAIERDAELPDQPQQTLIPGEDPNLISGDHKFYGVLMLGGRSIRADNQITGAGLTDLAPTILSLMDVPIPAEMDGRVLTEALEADAVRADMKSAVAVGAAATPAFSDHREYSDDDQEIIAERLRSLGYIE